MIIIIIITIIISFILKLYYRVSIYLKKQEEQQIKMKINKYGEERQIPHA